MILETLNPQQVVLQIQAQNIDGTPKTALASATVRVYRVTGSGEVNVLASTPLQQVGSTNTWRYVWTPASLVEGVYYIEYSLIDTDGAAFVAAEELVVKDIAKQADLAFVKQIEQGRWKIANNKMYFYDADNVTPLLVFDLKDLNGIPSMVQVFERVPV